MYENCYFVSERKAEDAHQKNATNKARADVELTLAELGMKEINIALEFGGENASIAASLKEHRATYHAWKERLSALGDGDLLVVQFPSISHCIFLGKLFRELRRRGVTVVLLIHDLEKLRFLEEDTPFKTNVRRNLDESNVLKSADFIIAHNQVMIDYLVSEGIAREKLVSLEIFDYRMPTDFVPHRPYEEEDQTNLDAPGADVIIAGNLDSDKVGYLKEIHRVAGVRFQLYGVGYKDSSDNAIYNGSFLPDELPAHLHGNFGLVWDGTSIDTCAGNYGNYLKYNDPHKTSLYLMCGFPVIVWDKSAISKFVLSHGAGIAVSSLLEIGDAIASLEDDDYIELCKHAAAVSADLRSGHYLKVAIQEIMDRLGRE